MAKRLTKANIEAAIYSVRYITSYDTSTEYLGTTTICVLTMKNGLKVIGTSACLNTDDYSESVGKQYAYDDAFKKLWELEGYAAADRKYRGGLAVIQASQRVTVSSAVPLSSLQNDPEFERKMVAVALSNRQRLGK